MFSEYASRFLAQSQSRLSFAPLDDHRQSSHRGWRQNQRDWRSSTTTSRLNAPRGGNPSESTASQLPGFPFGSRPNPQNAPLFYSVTDEFREENDEEEHEREIADFYALQKSRRHLGASDFRESSEVEEDSSSSLEGSGSNRKHQDGGFGRMGGIKSSWRGGVASGRGRVRGLGNVDESPELAADDRSLNSGMGRSHLSEVRLEDTIRTDVDDEPPEDLMEDPPSIQQLRTSRSRSESNHTDRRQRGHLVSGPSPEVEPVLQSASERPRHDLFWGHVYILALTGMFTTWFVVYLHTDAPNTGKKPLGDTIYTTLHGSFHLLAVFTLVSIFVSLFWLAALRAYVRNLVYAIVLAVPVVLSAFSLYPFISSFRGERDGSGIQDTAMRWSALLPGIMAVLWVVAVIRGRLAMQKAITILEFATKVLATNPALLVVGFTVLGSIVGFTWLWLSMFTRIFLGGHWSNRSMITRFVIDASTWWLGVYFILVYLWTIAMIFGMQRTVTSATVSQWYFHRLAVPAPSSQTIVKAAVTHSATTLFGTVALATALSLMVRLPLLILPRRVSLLLGVAMYSLIPTPVTALINPLSLTYAAIHSQSLTVSARGLMQLHFLTPDDATSSLHPNTFHSGKRDGWLRDTSPLVPYRLAKLLLHATRLVMCLALGYGGWVSTARSLEVAGTRGVKGSLYAYVVGLVAGAIGWGILGSMEGILSCIVDAIVVCWASEVGSSGKGEVRYCREAALLFGDEDQRDGTSTV